MTRKNSKKEAEEVDGFPRELLKQPKEKWEEYFKGYGVDHTVFHEACSKLMRFALGKSSKMLVFVIGPTGVGKTFLRECMEDELNAIAAADPNWDPGRIPSISVEVPGKDSPKPSWTGLYERQLRALCEPEKLIGKKIIYGDIAMKFDNHGQLSFGTSATARKIRYALEQALVHRDPLVVSYEEAQQLLDFAGLSFQEQTDCVKSIANMTKKRHALFGNYDMKSLLELSDQLMRRSSIIHVSYYGHGRADVPHLRNTIYSFQLNMPFEETPDLLKHFDYLCERSACCVGILADWLRDAYSQALSEPKATTLKLKHLEDNVPFTAGKARKLRDRIAKDEREFLEEFGEVIDSGMPAQEEVEIAEGMPSDETPSKPRQRRRVGERAPVRDKNGMEERNAA